MKKITLLPVFLAIAVFASAGAVYALARDGTPDENDMFGAEETVKPREAVTDDAVASGVEKESVSFNGFLNSRNGYYMNREWVTGNEEAFRNNTLFAWMQSNFTLDARLREGIKGYASVSLNYYPAGTSQIRDINIYTIGSSPLDSFNDVTLYERTYALWQLNELFLDMNIKKIVYFRAGKQTLKWGQGYFWTPTDLINIEKKSFLDPYQVREGVYGLKMHVPFGTRANFYSFVNFNDATNLDELGLATKIEVLIGTTEMGLSAAFKKHNVPVYGVETTGRLFTVDLRGEASLSYGENTRRADTESLSLPWDGADPAAMPYESYRRKGRWTPKACVGAGRSFDFMDVSDRIRIDVEFFYNGSGYSENIFNRSPYASAYVYLNGLTETNYHGMYYIAGFISCSRILWENLAGSLNYIANLSDRSSIISGMLSCTMAYNLTLGLMVNGFLGRTNREYTQSTIASWSGEDIVAAGGPVNALATEISAKIVF